MLVPAVSWLLGPSYLPAVISARLLVWCVPPFVLCGLAHTTLLAAHRQGRAAWWMVVMVAVGMSAGILTHHFQGATLTALVPGITGCVLGVVLWKLVVGRRIANTRPAVVP